MSAESKYLGRTGGEPSSQDEAATKVAGEAHEVVQKLIMAALSAAANSHQQALVIASMSTVGALHVLAKLLQGKEDGEKEIPLNSTQVLMAALIAYRIAPCETRHGLSESEFSPRVMVDAFTDFERLTGRRPDDDLAPGWAEMTRNAAVDPVALAQMERARRGGAHLN